MYWPTIKADGHSVRFRNATVLRLARGEQTFLHRFRAAGQRYRTKTPPDANHPCYAPMPSSPVQMSNGHMKQCCEAFIDTNGTDEADSSEAPPSPIKSADPTNHFKIEKVVSIPVWMDATKKTEGD